MGTSMHMVRFLVQLREQRRKRRRRSLDRAYSKDLAGRGRDERAKYGGPGHGVW